MGFLQRSPTACIVVQHSRKRTIHPSIHPPLISHFSAFFPNFSPSFSTILFQNNQIKLSAFSPSETGRRSRLPGPPYGACHRWSTNQQGKQASKASMQRSTPPPASSPTTGDRRRRRSSSSGSKTPEAAAVAAAAAGTPAGAPRTNLASRACDACRARRRKCHFDDAQQAQCRDCARLGIACSFLVPTRPRGPKRR